jgi:glutathione synthase
MRIGFVINDIQTEKEGYTATRLAQTALNRGHGVWMIGVADLAYDPDEQVRARALIAPRRGCKSLGAFLADLKTSGSTSG